MHANAYLAFTTRPRRNAVSRPQPMALHEPRALGSFVLLPPLSNVGSLRLRIKTELGVVLGLLGSHLLELV